MDLSEPQGMPDTAPLTLARALLDLTRRQAAAAAAGDWEAVVDLLDRRAPLVIALTALDPAPLDEATRSDLRAALATALDLEHQTTDLAKTTQEAVGDELGRLGRGSRALRAYSRQSHSEESTLLDKTR